MKLEKKVARSYVLIFQVGFSIIVSIAIGLGIGVLLANIFNSDIFVIIFIIIGILAGIKTAYKLIEQEYNTQMKEDKKKNDKIYKKDLKDGSYGEKNK